MATGSTARHAKPHSSLVSYIVFSGTGHACTKLHILCVQCRAASVVEQDT